MKPTDMPRLDAAHREVEALVQATAAEIIESGITENQDTALRLARQAVEQTNWMSRLVRTTVSALQARLRYELRELDTRFSELLVDVFEAYKLRKSCGSYSRRSQ